MLQPQPDFRSKTEAEQQREKIKPREPADQIAHGAGANINCYRSFWFLRSLARRGRIKRRTLVNIAAIK